MEKIIIQESSIELTHDRKGQIAVLMYVGDKDPVAKLNLAVSQYVGNFSHIQFVDINMDNPWVRVIITGINEMNQEDFNPLIHKLKGW